MGLSLVKSLNIYRSNHQTCSIKKVILNKIFQNFQENTCVGVSFLMKLLALGLQFCWKRDSETGVFIWILKNFQDFLFIEHLWFQLLYLLFSRSLSVSVSIVFFTSISFSFLSYAFLSSLKINLPCVSCNSSKTANKTVNRLRLECFIFSA